MSTRADILLVSLGTTRGWQHADALFADDLARAGAQVAVTGVRMGASGRLRRAYPVNDFVEALAARRAARAAVRSEGPRAVVFSTTTAALLRPRLDVPYAVRLDAPARLNRPGLPNRPLHLLERRALAGARLVLPWSQAARAALPSAAAHAIVVPPPIEPSGAGDKPREALAVAYVPDPKAKGLDLLCAAWAAAAVPGARLEVFGVERDRGLRHLARVGLSEPPALVWRGLTSPAEFRSALRRARVLVGSARWEDFGQAPLEALADGALFATVPSGGPFEALALARTLAPELVASELSGDALARSVRAAFELDDERVREYRKDATTLLGPYRPDAVAATVADEVVPALLER